VQRSIEILIGRLITDEGFRRLFVLDPAAVLVSANDWGLQLTHSERAAILATDSQLWEKVADQIDSRLQKASLGRLAERTKS
jgi:hypothetical protein